MTVLSPTPQHKLSQLRAQVQQLAAGRPVELVAVTKTVSIETALALASAGQRDFGENRVDELERKAQAFQAQGIPARWHFIGHLQRNKAKRLARVADVLHSLDSLELAQDLERELARLDRTLDVYVQVKLWEEPTKSGLAPEALPALWTALATLPHLRCVGLMSMGPLLEQASERAAAARSVFTRLRALADQLGPKLRCSMGMSEDYRLALEAGADVLRIGSLLFEEDPA